MTGQIERCWARRDGVVYRVPDPAMPNGDAPDTGAALVTLYHDGRARCHTEGADACRHTMRLRLWAIVEEEASHAGSDMGDRLRQMLGRVGQAAGSGSVTGWTPPGMAPPGSPPGQSGPAPREHGGPGQAMPVREPWMRRWEWERHCERLGVPVPDGEDGP